MRACRLKGTANMLRDVADVGIATARMLADAALAVRNVV